MVPNSNGGARSDRDVAVEGRCYRFGPQIWIRVLKRRGPPREPPRARNPPELETTRRELSVNEQKFYDVFQSAGDRLFSRRKPLRLTSLVDNRAKAEDVSDETARIPFHIRYRRMSTKKSAQRLERGLRRCIETTSAILILYYRIPDASVVGDIVPDQTKRINNGRRNVISV